MRVVKIYFCLAFVLFLNSCTNENSSIIRKFKNDIENFETLKDIGIKLYKEEQLYVMTIDKIGVLNPKNYGVTFGYTNGRKVSFDNLENFNNLQLSYTNEYNELLNFVIQEDVDFIRLGNNKFQIGYSSCCPSISILWCDKDESDSGKENCGLFPSKEIENIKEGRNEDFYLNIANNWYFLSSPESL